MTLVFQEQQPFEKWIKLFVWGLIVCYAMLLLGILMVLHPPVFIFVASVFSLLVCLFAAYNFRSLRIQIKKDAIQVGFGVFRKEIPWHEIVSVRLQPYLFSRFLGWGIVLDFRGTIGFVARRSMGVELTLRDGKKYFFSTWHPDELVEIIRARSREAATAKN